MTHVEYELLRKRVPEAKLPPYMHLMRRDQRRVGKLHPEDLLARRVYHVLTEDDMHLPKRCKLVKRAGWRNADWEKRQGTFLRQKYQNFKEHHDWIVRVGHSYSRNPKL